jgi:hypothetical protein
MLYLFLAWVLVLTIAPICLEAAAKGWHGTIVVEIWATASKSVNQSIERINRRVLEGVAKLDTRTSPIFAEFEGALRTKVRDVIYHAFHAITHMARSRDH